MTTTDSSNNNEYVAALRSAPNEQQLANAKAQIEIEKQKLAARPPQLSVGPGHSHAEVNWDANGKPILIERKGQQVHMQMPDPTLIRTPWGTEMPRTVAQQMGWLNGDQWTGPGGDQQQGMHQQGSEQVDANKPPEGAKQEDAGENTYAMNATADLFAET